jgi:hypothetical protein
MTTALRVLVISRAWRSGGDRSLGSAGLRRILGCEFSSVRRYIRSDGSSSPGLVVGPEALQLRVESGVAAKEQLVSCVFSPRGRRPAPRHTSWRSALPPSIYSGLCGTCGGTGAGSCLSRRPVRRWRFVRRRWCGAGSRRAARAGRRCSRRRSGPSRCSSPRRGGTAPRPGRGGPGR